MVDKRRKDIKICQEFSVKESEFWFTFKQQKFLHNIDTFYYSVKLKSDFLKDTDDFRIIDFRNYFKKEYASLTHYGDFKPFYLEGCTETLNLHPVTFAGFYNINIECPEMFDIFIAETVPEASDIKGNKLGYSDTSEIIVQIRSCMLWLHGVHYAFERSYEVVKQLLAMFKLEPLLVQENRIDYCWHTNYHSNPEKFFNIENLMQMQVSRYKRIRQDFEVIGNKGDYEMDYLALGKRGDKCFVRIYLKSKEVVEKGYKQFFFKVWLFNGLINRYDLYCYEKAFLERSWRYLDVARLEFYIEYGTDKASILRCKELLERDSYDYDAIRSLADNLTPKVNKIMNVEYQTMRRHTKSYVLLKLKDNPDNECKRIYDYLDNRLSIIEYLTRETFRLVKSSGDTNKSRRDFHPFWEALRRTKLIDIKIPKNKIPLVREYSRKLSYEFMKKRVVDSAITLSIYQNGKNENDIMTDCMDALLRLNDNDIYDGRKYKQKKLRQFNEDELSHVLKTSDERLRYHLVDEDGVLYGHSSMN